MLLQQSLSDLMLIHRCFLNGCWIGHYADNNLVHTHHSNALLSVPGNELNSLAVVKVPALQPATLQRMPYAQSMLCKLRCCRESEAVD
jgi:hypothetical protein